MKNLVSITMKIIFTVLIMMILSFSGIALAQDEAEGEPQNIEYRTLIADDGTEFIIKKSWEIHRIGTPMYISVDHWDVKFYTSEIICNDISIWQYMHGHTAYYPYDLKRLITDEPIYEITIEKDKEYKDFETYLVTVTQYTSKYSSLDYTPLNFDNKAGYIKKDGEYFEISTQLLWIDKENHKYCGSVNESTKIFDTEYYNDPEYYNAFKEMYIDILDSYILKYKEYIAEEKYFNINKDVSLALYCISKFDEELSEKYNEELSYIRKSKFWRPFPF